MIICLDPPSPMDSSGVREADEQPLQLNAASKKETSQSLHTLHLSGFTWPGPLDPAGGLLPHRCTIACAFASHRLSTFLWHYPHGRPHRALPGYMLCGARTFLRHALFRPIRDHLSVSFLCLIVPLIHPLCPVAIQIHGKKRVQTPQLRHNACLFICSLYLKHLKLRKHSKNVRTQEKRPTL